jgi:hypothetical protein
MHGESPPLGDDLMPLKPAAALSKDKLGASHPAALQHRHFAVIAGILANLDRDSLGLTQGQHLNICQDFASELSGTNPKFDERRFMVACGFAAP